MREGKVRVVTLPVSCWQRYKELRLRALQKEQRAFYSTYEREIAWSDEEWQKSLQSVADGNSWIFFAQLDRRLVGMIGGYRNEEDKQNHRAQIWGMYVDKIARKKGIGKALVKNLLDELGRNREIQVVRLEVNVNQESARRLYEFLGFRRVGSNTIVFGDGLQHEVLVMEKLLHKGVN